MSPPQGLFTFHPAPAVPPPPPPPPSVAVTLWFKGYDGVTLAGVPATHGGAIDRMHNFAGPTDALIAGPSSPKYYANEVNGKGIVRFASVDDWLEVANAIDSDLLHPNTFFAIVRIASNPTFVHLLSKGSDPSVQQYEYSVTALPVIAYCHNGVCVQTGVVSVVGQWIRIIIRGTAAPANRMYFYLNGVGLGNGPTVLPQVGNGAAARIGNTAGETVFSPFDLLEMGVISGEISVAEVATLNTYLAGIVGA